MESSFTFERKSHKSGYNRQLAARGQRGALTYAPTVPTNWPPRLHMNMPPLAGLSKEALYARVPHPTI